MNNVCVVVAGFTSLILSGSAFAEPFGLLNARSAIISKMPDKAIEVGGLIGEFDDIDYEHLGARFNYKVNPTTVAYGDIGQTKQERNVDLDGTTYGVGGYWQVDDVFTGSDFGIHASFHKFKLEPDSGSADVSGNSITIEALFSGREPVNAKGNMFWNASLGLNRLRGKVSGGSSDSDTELTFSGGVVMQNATQSGEFYGGIFYLDDLAFGAGYRHFLK